MKKFIEKCLSIAFALQLIVVSNASVFAASESALRVMDTTAGIPAMVMVQGEPREVIQLTFTNPYKSTISQQFQLNEEGVLNYWYPQAVIAGEYQVSFDDHRSNFVVTPGPADPQKSELELTDYTAFVGEEIQGSLTLKDRYGNIIRGRSIVLENKGLGKVSCYNNCKTNQDGMIRFAMNSKKAGLEKLTVLDAEKNLKIYQEDVGFIPQVQQQSQGLAFPYLNYGSVMPQYQPYNNNNYTPYGNNNSFQTSFNPPPTASFDYIPVKDPTIATFNAQGNNDQFLGQDLNAYFGGNLLEPELIAQIEDSTTSDGSTTSSTTTTPSTTTAANTGAAGSVSSFEIIFGDSEGDFEEEVTLAAQTAQDITVRAVDALGNVVEDYTGQIEFELEPDGLVPNDYTFSEVDQGEALFELALVLPVGDFTLTVQDTTNPNINGEVQILSQFEGIPNLNNTNIQLTIDSPVANSVYADNFTVQGSSNTENTEIIVSEGPLELKRGQVDEDRRFNFVMDLSDGNHTLEITAIYLPDGSETSATIPLEVDKTPPVITSVDVPDEPVRAGEQFTITAVAEERSEMQVFINNRSYDFVSKGGGEYELNANAPLDPGTYPVHARATDELGNVSDSPNVGTLEVVPGLQEVGNLFGIPGVGTITLSWNAVEGAAAYEVSYQSILGQSQQELETTENRITVEDLAENLSYIFTVVAIDEEGNELSMPTKSKAIKVLAAPAGSETTVTTPVITTPEPTVTRPAAEVTTEPTRMSKSGPEVYLLIIASLIVLNLYGRARRCLAIRD